MNIRKVFTALCIALACGTTASAQQSLIPAGKEIYIPVEFKDMDFNDPESKWSYHRMAVSENVVVFWEKGFGNDLSKAPDLEGKNMKVDLQNLLSRLEYFYTTYRDEMKFILPGSKADRYRMMCMLNYSLEGTAYGGAYDGQIGALWTAPNRIQDKKLNCIAHELGHSFQSQVSCDGQGQAWGGGGIFEMTSQWMLWNVNPEWTTDENYHWQDFKKKIHFPFLHGTNIYHSPYVLEYWSMKRGKTVIGELFRHGRRGEDPASTYMRLYNVDVQQMSDEMYDCYSRLQTFDFPRVKDCHRKFAGEMSTPMTKGEQWMPQTENIPGTWGFNVVDLPIPADGKKISVKFEGLGDKTTDDYRYGIVAIDKNGNADYGQMMRGFKGKVSYQPTADTKKVVLVVVGCPKSEYKPTSGNPYQRKQEQKMHTYNYKLTL